MSTHLPLRLRVGLAVSELQRQHAENHSKVQRQLDGFDRKLQDVFFFFREEVVKGGVGGFMVGWVGWLVPHLSGEGC